MAKYSGLDALREAYNNGEFEGKLAKDVVTTEITSSQADTNISIDVAPTADTSLRDKVAGWNISESVTVQFAGQETIRDKDDAAERRFDGYVQRKIYPALIQKGLAERIDPVYDTERQCAGSDAIYLVSGQQIRVDNKNRASVCNTHSRGVPYELYTNNRNGKRIVGWGADKEKNTDYIMSTHCYVDGSNKKVKFNDISMDDISRVDIFIYKMDDVRHYLASKGYSIDKLLEEAKRFEREFIDKYKGVRPENIPDSARRKAIGEHEFLYTSYFKLKEDPTVVLIDESVIKELPNTRHFMWNEAYGLIEVLDKKNRPPLTPSETPQKQSRSSRSKNNDITL